MKLNYKLKIVLAMAGLILVVSFFSLTLSRRAVRSNFEELLNRQFAELADNFAAARRDRVDALAEFLADATNNPRISAAFEVGIHDGYERFYFDIAFEMREIVERYASDARGLAPFYRFVDYEGVYLEPPAGALESKDIVGLRSPFPEPLLREKFLQHTSERLNAHEPRSGYEAFPLGDRSVLLELLVIPTFDGAGYEMGDLVFARSVDRRDFAVPGSSAQTALQVGGEVYTADRDPAMEARLAALIDDDTDPASPNRRLAMGAMTYAVFNQAIPQGPDFPRASQVTLFSLEEEQRILAAIQNALIAVTAGALILGLVLSLLAAQRLSRRVQGLVAATREIARGNFGYRVRVSGRDEISQLGDSFNAMSVDLQQKEMFRSVLEKVTDREVARQLTSGALELGGEERDATVLFCDIRQFTPLSRTKSAREIVELLNHHMTALTAVVHRYHGVVDKFVGDEIMALFGVPRSTGNDAENAVRCARDMLARREALNAGAVTPIQIGIGIATGQVVAGCMGSKDRLNYTVIGNCVNLAARLCGNAAPGQLLFDAHTAEALPGADLVKCNPMQLKGFTARIPVYTLSAPHALPPKT